MYSQLEIFLQWTPMYLLPRFFHQWLIVLCTNTPYFLEVQMWILAYLICSKWYPSVGTVIKLSLFCNYLKRKIYVYSKTLLSLVNLLYINTNTMPLCCLGQRMKWDSDDGLLAMAQWAQSQTTPVLCPAPLAQIKWRVFMSPSDLDYHEWLGTRMCIVFLLTFYSILLEVK